MFPDGKFFETVHRALKFSNDKDLILLLNFAILVSNGEVIANLNEAEIYSANISMDDLEKFANNIEKLINDEYATEFHIARYSTSRQVNMQNSSNSADLFRATDILFKKIFNILSQEQNTFKDRAPESLIKLLSTMHEALTEQTHEEISNHAPHSLHDLRNIKNSKITFSKWGQITYKTSEKSNSTSLGSVALLGNGNVIGYRILIEGIDHISPSKLALKLLFSMLARKVLNTNIKLIDTKSKIPSSPN